MAGVPLIGLHTALYTAVGNLDLQAQENPRDATLAYFGSQWYGGLIIKTASLPFYQRILHCQSHLASPYFCPCIAQNHFRVASQSPLLLLPVGCHEGGPRDVQQIILAEGWAGPRTGILQCAAAPRCGRGRADESRLLCLGAGGADVVAS